MASVNKALLIGRLGNDPKYKKDSRMCTFSMATSRRWRDKSTNESKEDTCWHNIIAWGNLASICSSYLSKGSEVYVEGRISNTKYTDSEGKDYFRSEIVASSVIFLSLSSKKKEKDQDDDFDMF